MPKSSKDNPVDLLTFFKPYKIKTPPPETKPDKKPIPYVPPQKLVYSRKKLYEFCLEGRVFSSREPVASLFRRLKSRLAALLPAEESSGLADRFIFVMFSFLFSEGNQLFSKKYSPVHVEDLFDKTFQSDFSRNLMKYFDNQSNTRNLDSELVQEKGNSNSFSGLYSYYSLSKNPVADAVAFAMVVNGPYGCGKSTAVTRVLEGFDFEIEKIDLSCFKGVKELCSKYDLAINSRDVKLNLVDHANEQLFLKLNNFLPKRKRIKTNAWNSQDKESKDRHKKFLVDYKPQYDILRMSNEDHFEERSLANRAKNGLNYYGRRKVYLCHNLEYLYYGDYSSDRKNFSRKWTEFLEFVNKSNYPFVFINVERLNVLFGEYIKLLTLVSKPSCESSAISCFIYLLVFFEQNFSNIRKALKAFEEGKQIEEFDNYSELVNFNLNLLEQSIIKNEKDYLYPDMGLIDRYVCFRGKNLDKIFRDLELSLDYFFYPQHNDELQPALSKAMLSRKAGDLIELSCDYDLQMIEDRLQHKLSQDYSYNGDQIALKDNEWQSHR